MTDPFDDLFKEAQDRLESQETPDAWGHMQQTQEGDKFIVRYLGAALLPPFDETVYRFVVYQRAQTPGHVGTPFYLKHKAQLKQTLERTAAQVGDVVGLVRGNDKDIGKDNPMETWDGWARPCDEPLDVVTPLETVPPGRDDIPF